MKARLMHHTGFQVADLERSLHYYRDLLGLKVVNERHVEGEYIGRLVGYPGVSLRVAYLGLSGSDHLLELLEYEGVPRTAIDAQTANSGTAHICFEVDDLPTIYARLVEAGYPPVGDPVRPTHGQNAGRLAVYAIDPDGIRVELIE
jgi:glyoxylase I family protein